MARFPIHIVKINVALAYRGQPQVDLPPIDSPQPGTPVPSLLHTLILQAQQVPTVSPQAPPGSLGRAPPASG